MSVLVLAPHADDEVLGCGATIGRLSASGESVYIGVLTDASVSAPENYSREQVEKVRHEARSAHSLLGVREAIFLDLPAPQLEQYPQYKLADAILSLVSRLNPHTVFIPHRGDLHMDHGAVFNAALVACRPGASTSVKRIFAYETLSETEWGHPFGDSAFIPNHFVNVSKTLKMKVDAMACFQSQLRDFPHPRSLAAIEHLAKYRGASIGVAAAEAFAAIRTIE